MVKNEITVTEFKAQLDRIEAGLMAQKNVLTFDETSHFTGLSKSFLYKLTSTRRVPHYKPHGKVIYFDRSQVEAWLLQNPIKTADTIEKEACSYVILNNRRAAK
jgi:excisionase family DNA binding protein